MCNVFVYFDTVGPTPLVVGGYKKNFGPFPTNLQNLLWRDVFWEASVAQKHPRNVRHVQLQQMKLGIITWVCTNSPTALDASVTAKPHVHAKLAE